MVIGASDTGKTTLIEGLAGLLAKEARIGIVDLDMGQSHLGPPTTIAWGKIEGAFPGWENIAVERFYFTGTTTPMGSLLPTLVGAKLLTDEAASLCNKVIIDTTGLIADPPGRVLKQSKIDLLAPDIVIALENAGELEDILQAFRLTVSPRIHRRKALEAARTKTPASRGLYRYQQMRSYLRRAQVRTAHLDSTAVRFTREALPFYGEYLVNRIVSFRNAQNRDTALGVIERVQENKGALLIRTPLGADEPFACIVVGKAEMDREREVVRELSR